MEDCVRKSEFGLVRNWVALLYLMLFRAVRIDTMGVRWK